MDDPRKNGVPRYSDGMLLIGWLSAGLILAGLFTLLIWLSSLTF